jgi:hypothetical protein
MATTDQPSPIVVEELHNDIQRALASTVNEVLAEGLRGDDALDRIVEDPTRGIVPSRRAPLLKVL